MTPFVADVLVAGKIPKAAYEGVKTTYAEKLLMYKDRVEVEYTANYVYCDSFLDARRMADRAAGLLRHLGYGAGRNGSRRVGRQTLRGEPHREMSASWPTASSMP